MKPTGNEDLSKDEIINPSTVLMVSGYLIGMTLRPDMNNEDAKYLTYASEFLRVKGGELFEQQAKKKHGQRT